MISFIIITVVVVVIGIISSSSIVVVVNHFMIVKCIRSFVAECARNKYLVSLILL